MMPPMAAEPAEEGWEKLTEVERTALWVTYARWLGSLLLLHPDTKKPYYEDPHGSRMVASLIPAKQQHELRYFFAPELPDIAGLTLAPPAADSSDAGPSSSTSTSSSSTSLAEQLRGLSPDAFRSCRAAFMAVRTALLDEMLCAELAANPRLKQVVLLGAGMDTRAWRLSAWNPGTRLYEVDTPAMVAFKQRVMQGAPPACGSRAAVAADARELRPLEMRLLAAGFHAAPGEGAAAGDAAAAAGEDAPATLWLLEGFIGYLTQEEGAALLQWMAGLSAPGSVLLMTAPPTKEEEQHARNRSSSDREEEEQQPQGPEQEGGGSGNEGASASTTPAAAAAADTNGASSSSSGGGTTPAAPMAPTNLMSGASVTGGHHPPTLKLHHSTFEEPEETAARAEAAGWRVVEMARAEEVAARYGTQRAQTVIRARLQW